MRTRISALLFLVLCVSLSGCVKRQESETGVVVSYQMWVGFAGVLGGIAASTAGWFMKNRGFRGLVFLIVAVAGTVTFSPFGFVDHVTITNERLQSKLGFWCFPTTHDIAFADVASVTLSKKIKSGRRGRKETNYYLDFAKKNGTVESITASNALVEEAGGDIMVQLDLHGIPFTDVTGE